MEFQELLRTLTAIGGLILVILVLYRLKRLLKHYAVNISSPDSVN